MNNPELSKILKDNYDIIYEKANQALIKAGRKSEELKIIAVSKTQPAKIVEAAIQSGINILGENYIQELTDKYNIITDKGIHNVEWHFIGNLQTNKIRFISPFIDYVHSVDTLKAANELNIRAGYSARKIKILFQINTSKEDSKSGCTPDMAVELTAAVKEFENIELQGLMTIGTFTDNEKIQRYEFSLLRSVLENINSQLGMNLKELSMGMTGDFETAIDEGSTMIRVGTAIFGSRTYKSLYP